MYEEAKKKEEMKSMSRKAYDCSVNYLWINLEMLKGDKPLEAF